MIAHTFGVHVVQRAEEVMSACWAAAGVPELVLLKREHAVRDEAVRVPKETRRRQKRLQTLSVPGNGNCVILSCLAHIQCVVRACNIVTSSVFSIRQSIGAASFGYLSHAQADDVLALLDIGAIVVRTNEARGGSHYFTRRPNARFFAVVEESSCLGGTHWNPVRLHNACGLHSMTDVQTELLALGIPERGYPESVVQDGVILID